MFSADFSIFAFSIFHAPKSEKKNNFLKKIFFKKKILVRDPPQKRKKLKNQNFQKIERNYINNDFKTFWG